MNFLSKRVSPAICDCVCKLTGTDLIAQRHFVGVLCVPLLAALRSLWLILDSSKSVGRQQEVFSYIRLEDSSVLSLLVLIQRGGHDAGRGRCC